MVNPAPGLCGTGATTVSAPGGVSVSVGTGENWVCDAVARSTRVRARVRSILLTLLAGRECERDEVREISEILIKSDERIAVR